MLTQCARLVIGCIPESDARNLPETCPPMRCTRAAWPTCHAAAGLQADVRWLRKLLGGVSGGLPASLWVAGDAVGPRSQELVMTVVKDPDRKRALVLRLKRVEGQLRGIQRQIDEDEDCEKIAQQLAAARKALDKSFYSLVGCVIAQGDVPADDVADMLTKFS